MIKNCVNKTYGVDVELIKKSCVLPELIDNFWSLYSRAKLGSLMFAVLSLFKLGRSSKAFSHFVLK